MQAQAKDNGRLARLVAVCFGHGLLEFDGGTQCGYSAGEFGTGTATRQLDEASAMAGQDRFEALYAVLRQPSHPAVFVVRRDAGATDHIRVKNHRPAVCLPDHGAPPGLTEVSILWRLRRGSCGIPHIPGYFPGWDV